MQILIRPEVAADYSETEAMIREAFWNRFAPGAVEHYLLHEMRGSADYIPELSCVAVCDGKIVGMVAFAKAKIVTDDGRDVEVVTLGPIGVLPEFQNQGVGKKLIAHTKNLATDLGYRAIFLCGDPDYYVKTGFVAAEDFGIRNEANQYMTALQAMPLFDGALDGLSGRYCESKVFQIDEAQAAEFDRRYPEKEKIEGTASQMRFLELVGMVRAFDK